MPRDVGSSASVESPRPFRRRVLWMARAGFSMALGAIVFAAGRESRAGELERLQLEILRLKAEVFELRQGEPCAADVMLTTTDFHMKAAPPRRMKLFTRPSFADEGHTHSTAMKDFHKVRDAFHSVVSNFSNSTHRRSGNFTSATVTMMKEIGEAKYRVSNVRFVFIGISWIFILGTSAWLIKDTFDCWVFPQYQALTVQTMLVLIVAAVPPSLDLFNGRRGSFWMQLIEVYCEGHLLLATSLWIPRILEAIVHKVRDVHHLFQEQDAAYITKERLDEQLQQELHKDMEFRIIDLSTTGMAGFKAFGIPADYTWKVACMLLYVVRPTIRTLLVTEQVSSVITNPRISQGLTSFFDFWILLCAVLVLYEGGNILFKGIPYQFKTDRLNMVTVQAIMFVHPIIEIALQIVTPCFILGYQLSDLLHVCVVGATTSFLTANRMGGKDVMLYMLHVMKDRGEERHRSKNFLKMLWILDPLLSFHSLRIPKHGFQGICKAMYTLLELEHSGERHWPYDDVAFHHRPLMPYEQKQEDENMHGITWRSDWPFVWADLFSSRIRSTSVTVGVTSIFFTVLVFRDEFFDFGPMSSWQALIWQVVLGFLIWIFSGMLLVGNNIFMPRWVFLLYSCGWLLALALSFVLNVRQFLFPQLHKKNEKAVLLGPEFKMWIHLVMAILCLLLAVAVLIRQRLGDRYSDFLTVELSSLMYSNALLQPCSKKQFLPGETVEVVHQAVDDWEDGEVQKDCGDGSYEVLLLRHKHVGHATNCLRKNMRRKKDEDGVLESRSRGTRKQQAKDFLLKFLKPLHKMPPVLMLSMAMSLVVVTAFSAVVGDYTTRVFLVVDTMHSLAEVGDRYVRQHEDCNQTGIALAKVVDLDESGTVSRAELPLYSILAAMPSSLRAHIVSKKQMKLLWPANNSNEISYSQVGSMLCNVESEGKYRVQNTHGFGALIQKAKHCNLTGQNIVDFYGGSVSLQEIKDTIYENIAIFSVSFAKLGEHIMDSVYPFFDPDHSGTLNGTEASTVALSLNFLVGRAPIILGLIPCPKYMRVAEPRRARRLSLAILLPMVRIAQLSDVNGDGKLDRQELRLLISAITWIPGLAWGKKFLVNTFYFFAGPAGTLKWKGITKLAEAIDAFIATGANLPKMLKSGKVGAKYFLPFLDENKDGMLERSETHGFEAYLSQSQGAAKADAIMERAFLVTDANGDGYLSGPELESAIFGKSIANSLGRMGLEYMQQSVVSTPANCISTVSNVSSNMTSITTVASPARSLFGRVVMGAAAHVAGAQSEPHEDDEADDGSETTSQWQEAAGRHLMESAGISRQLGGNYTPTIHTTVYSVAAQAEARARAAKDGIKSVLGFFRTVQEVTQPKEGSLVDAFLREISSAKIRLAIWLIAIGVFAANVSGDLYVCFVCYKLVRKYQSLMDSFTKGHPETIENTYQGYSYATSGKLRSSFAAASYLPGTMWFNIILSWIIFFLIFVSVWTGVVLGVLYSTDVFPFCGPYLTYLSGSLCIGAMLRWRTTYLQDNGDIIMPLRFPMVWMLLVVINFVVGVNLAILRFALLIMYTMFSCTFLHYSVLPEWLLRFDTGYFAFLSMTFTFYERHNPLKHAFNTVFAPQTHKLYGPRRTKRGPNPEGYAQPNSDEEIKFRRTRAKVRFALALTLFRNPTLIHERRSNPDEDTVASSADTSITETSERLATDREEIDFSGAYYTQSGRYMTLNDNRRGHTPLATPRTMTRADWISTPRR